MLNIYLIKVFCYCVVGIKNLDEIIVYCIIKLVNNYCINYVLI